MMNDRITIVIADDHAMVADGFGELLNKLPGVSVIGVAKDGRDAIAKVEKLRPSIVLLDIELPGLNGIDVADEIHRRFPSVGIIMVTAHPWHDYVVRSLRAGARGYVSKGPAFEELRLALQAVVEGDSFLSPVVCNDFIRNYLSGGQAPKAELELLTSQQRRVTQLLSEGSSNKQVAAILNISVKMADKHRRDVMKRLGIDSLAALTLFAVRAGLVDPWSRGTRRYGSNFPVAM